MSFGSYQQYYQPQYGNTYSNYGNPYFQQPMQQINNTAQQYPQSQNNQIESNNNMITCQFVDGIDVVKAINSDMNGRPTVFVKTDGTEIYKKQLNSTTGLTDLLTYELKKEHIKPVEMPEKVDLSPINAQIIELKQELGQVISGFSKDLAEIKDLVLDTVTTPSKGGGK